jgi:hypothetical protein
MRSCRVVLPVNDGGGASPGTPGLQDWKEFRKACFWFLAVSVAVWVVLYAVYASFPYLQSGSDVVIATKRSYSLSHPVFGPDARVRVLVFGDSRTLAAFNPRVFDRQLAQDGLIGKVESFNEGLPGETRYVVYLDQLLSSGVRPTHVLLQFPPVSTDHETTWREWLQHDKMIVDTLFPFRTLPRNLTLFLFSAVGHGGIAEYYRENAKLTEQIVSDRGYFFIKSQSHYPGDRLPDDYGVPTDTPGRVSTRNIDTTLMSFARLASLSERYGFKVIFIPPAYRIGELAQATPRRPTFATMDALPRFSIAGEDYWLFPPRFFSDPIHTNGSGAELYSTRLAGLLAPMLKQDDR